MIVKKGVMMKSDTRIWREHNLVWFFEPSGVKLDVQFFPAGVGQIELLFVRCVQL